ncbi:hypothetical protein [Enterobacter ludwigii]|uniref:hypothetical protein n=1 Tax=Enterobacter ludwigii TaxID=299767 RepID=UPI003F5BF031
MQVTIDGVPFVPACASVSRIGIAITTHYRAEVLKRAIEQHMKYLHFGALLAVIDDGSQPAASVPDDVQLLRHETSFGIVASKNAILSVLTYAVCDHLFLGDDDAFGRFLLAITRVLPAGWPTTGPRPRSLSLFMKF